MNETDFSRMKAAAMQEMREMNARSGREPGGQGMPPTPHFVRTGRPGRGEPNRERAVPPPTAPPPKTPGQNSLFSGWDLPFLDRLKTEGDLALILGLLLILFSEQSDKKLLFALLYILL